MPTLSTTDADLPAIDDWVAGDSRRLQFTVETADGTPKDLSTDNLEWYLTRRPYQERSAAVLDDTDPEVEIVTSGAVDPTQGEFRVDVSEAALSAVGAWGEHYQHVVVDPPDESRQSWRGRVVVVAD